MVSEYCHNCGNLGESESETDDGMINVEYACHFFEKTFRQLEDERTGYEIRTGVSYFKLDTCIGHTNPCGNCGKPEDGDCFRDCPQLDGGF